MLPVLLENLHDEIKRIVAHSLETVTGGMIKGGQGNYYNDCEENHGETRFHEDVKKLEALNVTFLVGV